MQFPEFLYTEKGEQWEWVCIYQTKYCSCKYTWFNLVHMHNCISF